MSEKEEILKFVKMKGPVIPNQIKKVLGGETYLISALLSELSSDGLVKISHTKIGASPTYYVPGQEFKLQELKRFLNVKDQKTFDLLKERKVLRDRNQELLVRVSVRKIKDFAKPLEVNIRGEKEVFWKWYLTPREEAESLIKKQIGTISPKLDAPIKQEVKETMPKAKPIEKEIEKEEKTPVKEETQKILKKEPSSDEDFIEKVYAYFEEKKIEIIEENIIRKKTDLEFEIVISSTVGKVEYFCKAKNKKKCNDGDLSSAYLTGQMKKLPVLFITTGEITKKAKEMLKKEFKGLVLKKI